MSGLLKFITCGSVDDGKSTLIGHILYDAKLLYADQEKALLLDSKVGTRGNEIDYSLLLDGLMAEREQKITIDVAYRYFNTDKRSFIVADTPGHEEYTRNMAVGASFAQLAIVMTDATKGVLEQTKRHAHICAIMGIRYFVFAVNKMDLAGYSKSRFEEIEKEIKELAASLNLYNIKVIPISAKAGDNVTEKSANMDWYQGETLLSYLENVEISPAEEEDIFYMPIQRVCRPDYSFRGFQGQVEGVSVSVSVGSLLTILPSREKAYVKGILAGDKQVDKAVSGQAVTIQLDKEVDISRGCVLTDCDLLHVTKNIKATILWMDDKELVIGKEYLAKLGTKNIPAKITKIKYKIDVNSGKHTEAAKIHKNELALCEISFAEKIVAEEFKKCRTLGEMILIDRVSHMTSACGVVDEIVSDEEKPYFRKGNLQSEGYIFEDVYCDFANLSMNKNTKERKTYEVGDTVPLKADSYHYPDYFDIFSIGAGLVVYVRNKKIKDMIPLEEYEYSGLPIVDERGFALEIRNEDDLRSFLEDFSASGADKKAGFLNKWSRFETYRKIVCTDGFWVI